MRVGLNSGEVVVRAIGNDLHMDYSAVGKPRSWPRGWNRRHTGHQPPRRTLRLAWLRRSALGPVPVKGLVEPVEVFELVGVTALRRRTGRRSLGADALRRAAARARRPAPGAGAGGAAGHGQVAALVGEGVGKSRLAYEFVHTHPTQDWLVLRAPRCPTASATPYFPVLDLLRRYCHLEEQDDPRTVRAKVTGQVLTLDEALQDTLPALLSLLEVLPDDSPFRTLDPPQRRQHTLQALKRCCAKARYSPCYWCLKTCTGSTPKRRPCSTAWWRACPRPSCCSWSTIAPNTSTAGGARPTTRNYASTRCPRPALMSSAGLAGGRPQPGTLKQLLIARTEGNPFFLEESAHPGGNWGASGRTGAYRLAQALPTIQVPATVQAVLAARIDRLPPEESGSSRPLR